MTGAVVDAGLKVHRALGPGLLESIYEECLARELAKRSIGVRRQVTVPLFYDGERLRVDLRLDLLVEESVIVEIKAVEALSRLHQAQLLTYLRCTGLRCGLLLNFNTELFKDGIKRLVL
ncbi:MAG TPA: GxxExxY protein [Caulobacteraceae bacterium]|nr:GxxExxY protein [Caulobacteraceae bacterium]